MLSHPGEHAWLCHQARPVTGYASYFPKVAMTAEHPDGSCRIGEAHRDRGSLKVLLKALTYRSYEVYPAVGLWNVDIPVVLLLICPEEQ